MSTAEARADVPGLYEVETASGRFVDTFLPRRETITLDDVAHHLAQTCRFAGAPSGAEGEPRPFSVAEHAVLVARKLVAEGAPRLGLPGLHHDDSEHVLGDTPSPLKVLLKQLVDNSHDLTYAGIEEGVGRACWGALSNWRPGPPPTALWWFNDQLHPLVKAADTWAARVEALYLMPSGGRHWTWGSLTKWGYDPRFEVNAADPLAADMLETVRTPIEAKALYLATHNQLVRAAPPHERVRRDVEAG